jgi:hypothetical protein
LADRKSSSEEGLTIGQPFKGDGLGRLERLTSFGNRYGTFAVGDPYDGISRTAT